MAETIEVTNATGDFEADMAASRAKILEGDPNANNAELGAVREEQARQEALDHTGRNALVETPYAEGETFSVVVKEVDEGDDARDLSDFTELSEPKPAFRSGRRAVVKEQITKESALPHAVDATTSEQPVNLDNK
jgi:hypothetical protein